MNIKEFYTFPYFWEYGVLVKRTVIFTIFLQYFYNKF